MSFLSKKEQEPKQEPKKIPVMRSILLYSDLRRLSNSFVVEFQNEVFPVLASLGLSDDESLRKHIWSTSFLDIYKDAVKKDKNRIQLFEDIDKRRGEDFWKPLRAEGCKVKTPEESGFQFKLLPFAFEPYRDKFLKAIDFKNGNFIISEEVLREESIITPEPWMEECFGMVSEFCESLKAKNFERKNIHALFAIDKDGNLSPNAEGIVFGNTTLH